MNKAPIFIVLMLLSACASAVGSTQSGSVKVIDEKISSKCDFVGDVHGISSSYGLFAAAGLETARQEAMNKVAKMGANAVLWKHNETGYGGTSIHGNAYTCPHLK